MANLREAFDYASQNPTSEFAQNLKQMAASGRLDEEAKKYGIDVSHFKPKTQPQTDLAQTGKNILGGIAEGVGGIGLTAIQKGGEALVNRFGTEQMKQNIANAPSLQEQLAQTTGADRESTAFGAARLGSNIVATALPIAKVGSVVGGIGQGLGAGKFASNVARGATEGYLFDVGTKATEGEINLTPGIGAAIGGTLPVVAPVVKGVGRLVQKAGEKTVGLATPTSAQEAQILQSYMAKKPFLSRVADVLSGSGKAPRTLAKTTAETTAGQTLPGIFGTKTGMGVQAKRASETLWKKVIEPRLEQSGKAVDVNGFFTKIGDDIVNSTDDITRQKSLLEALESVKEDYAGINSVTLPKLQKLKEGWAEFVPNKFYKGKDIAGSLGQVRALLAKEARDTIYNTLGDDVRNAYLDYGNLIGLQEMGQTAMTGAKLKGGAGSFIQELVSEAVTPIATIGGQILYRTGKGIEFIGNVGANTVGEALGVGSSKKAAEHVGDTIKNSKLNKGMIELNPKNWFEEVGNNAENGLKAKTKEYQLEMAKDAARTMRNNGVSVEVPTSKNAVQILEQAKELARKKKVSDIIKAETPSEKMKPFLEPKKKVVSSLEQEAKKYKSAEEFVKAQGTPVYHGGGKTFDSLDEINFDEGFYMLKKTDSDLKKLKNIPKGNYYSYDDLAKMPAEAFGGKVTDFVANFKKPLIVDAKGKGWMELADDEISDFTARLVSKAKKQGNDGVVIKNIREGFSGKGTLGEEAGLVDDYIALDKNTLKTKSQLTDIWNKANKK